MKKQSYGICVLGFAMLLGAGSAAATTNRYVEDFTSTQYEDTLNTTALWDTVAGELALPPFRIGTVGGYARPGFSFDVALAGDYAYVVNGSLGLQVFDITDPTAPTLAGTYPTPGVPQAITIAGDYAFLADGNRGLRIVDITDPTNPTFKGTFDTLGSSLGVAVAGDYVFLADGGWGLQVFDISNPALPTVAGNQRTPSSAYYSVALSGNYAYVAGWLEGMHVIDITDPTNPTAVGNYNTPDMAYDVVVAGDYAYVADGHSGLQVIDIRNPTNPVLAGSLNTTGSAYGIRITGDYAYVADSESGVHAIDISDPTAPVLVASYDTPASALGLATAGQYAFVTDGVGGLVVLEISRPRSAVLAGSYDTSGGAWDVVLAGDHAYVADGGGGVQVIDITEPSAPFRAGGYNTSGFAYGVAVDGNYAFVADQIPGVRVIDVSNPALPTPVGSYDTPGRARELTIAGDYAYVADEDSGLQVIDISDPAAPTYVSSYDTSPFSALSVAQHGDYMFVVNSVVDVSNPAMPTLAGTFFGGTNYDFVSHGDFMFVANGAFSVLDITDPANPTSLGGYSTPGTALQIAPVGDRAFVADVTGGLQVMDITDPANPALVESYPTPGQANGVAVDGDYAFIADGTSGLHAVQVFQREFETGSEVGQSLAVDGANDTILRARLATTQQDTVTWALSADGGLGWLSVHPGGGWHRFTDKGTDLVWRSTHHLGQPGVNPAASRVDLEWLYEFVVIDSIVDVPNDQGGWARLYFTRSGYDFPDETSIPILSYNVHRRVDNAALVSEIHAGGEPVRQDRTLDSGEGLFVPAAERVVQWKGRYYLVGDGANGTSPPGVWEIVATVAARQQDTYVALLPTLADSSATLTYTAFFVAAHTTTPSIFFDSPPDSGYSVDNIVPAAPQGFSVAYNTGSGNQLTWNASADPDFQYFRIYRDTYPGFTPSVATLVHSTVGIGWFDPFFDGWNVYYKLTAVDASGNESPPASPATATAIRETQVPHAFALYQNAPNPFNPTTEIRYDVPAAGGRVTLRIYDAAGRLVRTLVDAAQAAGEKRAAWDGRNNWGHRVATGVYFYRMTAPGFSNTRKMVLLQ